MVWRASDKTILMQVPLRGFPVGLQLNDAAGIQFSPDGTIVALNSGSSIRLLRVADGSIIARLAGHREQIASIAFSPDGTRIASASGVPREFVPNGHLGDRSVRVYAVADGRLLQVYEGANARMPGLGWSPDSRTLAAGSVDRTLRFWTER